MKTIFLDDTELNADWFRALRLMEEKTDEAKEQLDKMDKEKLKEPETED